MPGFLPEVDALTVEHEGISGRSSSRLGRQCQSIQVAWPETDWYTRSKPVCRPPDTNSAWPARRVGEAGLRGEKAVPALNKSGISVDTIAAADQSNSGLWQPTRVLAASISRATPCLPVLSAAQN
jgi:hypothetical protein